jgi:Rrf2 family protein
MIYSRSSEYAIRACVNLARVSGGKCAMVKDIAQKESVPAHFLAKILQSLARKGLLRSTKGPSGGFYLDRPARTVTLLDIVQAVDGLESYDRCVAGLARCSDGKPCPMHRDWTRLRSRIMDYLGGTSVGSLARSTSRAAGQSAASERRVAIKRS